VGEFVLPGSGNGQAMGCCERNKKRSASIKQQQSSPPEGITRNDKSMNHHSVLIIFVT
jgi:hypothetical protein